MPIMEPHNGESDVGLGLKMQTQTAIRSVGEGEPPCSPSGPASDSPVHGHPDSRNAVTLVW